MKPKERLRLVNLLRTLEFKRASQSRIAAKEKENRKQPKYAFSTVATFLMALATFLMAATTIYLGHKTGEMATETKRLADFTENMANETKKLADLSAEQFKIKSYPSFIIEAEKVSVESEKIHETWKITNKGEIAAHKFSFLMVHVYRNEKNNTVFNPLSAAIYKGEERVVKSYDFQLKIAPGEREIVTTNGSIPERLTFSSLEHELLFLRFQVPYDDKYRYEVLAYQLKTKVTEKGNEYFWQRINSSDTNYLLSLYISRCEEYPDAIQEFLKDFDRNISPSFRQRQKQDIKKDVSKRFRQNSD